MLQITNEFKQKVAIALLEVRQNFTGSDAAFAKQWGMNNSVFSRLKGGETDKLLRDAQWLHIGRKLEVSLDERKWNMARTDVFDMIEEDVMFCQQYAKSKICVDDPAIGKTYSAKYLSRNLQNCFYLDASQAKTKQSFIRLLAGTLGLDNAGRYIDVKDTIKYYLRMLPNPIVILDEAGDLDYPAFLELKELWNATEGACGWYMMGADGLRAKIEQGMRSKKVGYRELFSRYSDSYTTIVPMDRQEKMEFYRKLIGDVLSVNMPDKSKLPEIVKRCLIQNEAGQIGGLRRAESLLILNP